jgi:hypothetical protein
MYKRMIAMLTKNEHLTLGIVNGTIGTDMK